jgi:hypothetical protein
MRNPPGLLRVAALWWAAALATALLGAATAYAGEGTRKFTCFCYWDVNRSGIYDVGDRPYMDLAIDVGRPDGSVIRRVSNLSGFVNFGMKIAGEEDWDIYGPGTYTFRARLPAGWISISPDVLDQSVLFLRRAGVRSGMAPEKGCDHIGIAPSLSASGLVAAADGTGIDGLSVTASDGARTVDVALDESGSFTVPLDPGRWTLVVENERDARSVKREVELDRFSSILSRIVMNSPEAKPVGGEIRTIGFDDLTTSDTLLEIPSGYEGLNWLYWIATHNKLYEGGGYINGSVSGEYIAYNSSGEPAAIWRDEPFDFLGVNIGAAWPEGEEDDLSVKGWRDGELAYHDVFRISNAGSKYFAADYLAVDRIEFALGNYERIVIDELKIRY